MIERKKKIRIIQISLLVVGLLIIFFTYIKNNNMSEEKIIFSESQKKIKQQMENQTEGDIFYNIEYSGLDLSGNRYILKSKEATTDEKNQDNDFQDENAEGLESESENEVCSICRIPFEDNSIVRSLNNCGHFFHQERTN